MEWVVCGENISGCLLSSKFVKYTFSWCPHLMKIFQISHLLDFWHFVWLFWFPEYFAQMAPILFSILSDLFCSLLCPLHEDPWFLWLCPQGSTGQSCLCLCTCLLPSAPRCKSLLTTFLVWTAHKTTGQCSRDICPFSMSLLSCRSVPSSWQICSFNLSLLSQVLNLGFFASLSNPARSYWECFQRTLIVSNFLFPEP